MDRKKIVFKDIFTFTFFTGIGSIYLKKKKYLWFDSVKFLDGIQEWNNFVFWYEYDLEMSINRG